MKMFSIFTKEGRVDLPIKDKDIKVAAAIAKNPLTDVVEKVRELSDLSRKLTKKQEHEVASGFQKLEFTDVDGRHTYIEKGAKWEACVQEVSKDPNVEKPEAVCTASVGKTEEKPADDKIVIGYEKDGKVSKTWTDEARAASAAARAGHSAPKEEGRYVTIDGKSKYFPPEESTAKPAETGANASAHDSTANLHQQVEAKTQENISAAQEAKDAEAKRYGSKEVPSKERAKQLEHSAAAQNFVHTNVPVKHQAAVRDYIGSDQFHHDVAGHAAAANDEKKRLGYMHGPHPAVRAINGFLADRTKKFESIRNLGAKVQKKTKE